MEELEISERTLAIEEKEQLVNRLTQELYRAHRGFIPRYPWVFVRVLDKEQRVGCIIVPETQQNKPQHEAIVLAVWKPFVDSRTKNGARITVYKKSELKPGDHVLLPHYAGLPVHGYKEQRYRIVKELGWDAAQDGGIYATVEYGPVQRNAMSELMAIIHNTIALVPTAGEIQDLQDAIADRFLIVDRHAKSVTLSGR